MTVMDVSPNLNTPEAYVKLLKRLGYDGGEISAAIAEKFELSTGTATRLVETTVVR